MAGSTKSSVRLVAQVFVLSIPVLLGVYWPMYSAAPTIAPMVMRCGLLAGAAGLAVFSFQVRVTRVETRFLLLFGTFFIALTIPSLTATDVPRAFTDVLKLLLVCGVGAVLARSLRDQVISRAFGRGMLLASLLPTSLIVVIYVKHLGLTLPSYEQLRILKGLVAKKEGMALNPIAFTALFMYIIGLCVVRPTRIRWAGGGLVFAVCGLLTGSRAPIGIAVLSLCALAILTMLQNRSLLLRLSGWLAILIVLVSTTATITALDPKQMHSLTEGRSDLWGVAWAKFVDRPITGYGYESWRDDLVSRLPGRETLTFELAAQTAGGYHNQYLTILAEEGVIGFVPALTILWFLWTCCRRLSIERTLEASQRQMIVMGCLFLLLRAAIEIPGLFGNGQEPADYLSYCFVAVVVGHLSALEDLREPDARRSVLRPHFV